MANDHSRDFLKDLLQQMVFIRRFEEKAAELYGAAKIRGFLHLYIGEEAIAVGVMRALNADDAIVATYREHGHALARGISPESIMAEMYGKQEGCSRGRGGSMHLYDRSKRFFGGNAIVGGGLPLAVGLALAAKMQGQQTVTACFFGDGAVNEGEFYESLNLASLWKLPVLFLCENNQFAMGTAIERCQAQTDILAKAQVHKVQGERVDGMDVLAVHEVARRAIEYVRKGEGPFFIEFDTYRFCAHSMFDPELYRSKADVQSQKHRDPIAQFEAKLLSSGQFTEEDFTAVETAVESGVEAAVAFAESGTWEPVSELRHDVSEEGF